VLLRKKEFIFLWPEKRKRRIGGNYYCLFHGGKGRPPSTNDRGGKGEVFPLQIGREGVSPRMRREAAVANKGRRVCGARSEKGGTSQI